MGKKGLLDRGFVELWHTGLHGLTAGEQGGNTNNNMWTMKWKPGLGAANCRPKQNMVEVPQ